MEVANCRLKLNKMGSDVPKYLVTPAEVLVLQKGFEANAGGNPISGIELIGTSKRSSAAELARLQSAYANLRVDDKPIVGALFPGSAVKLPETFLEIGITAPVATHRKPGDYTPEPLGDPVMADDTIALIEGVEEDIAPIVAPAALPSTKSLPPSSAAKK